MTTFDFSPFYRSSIGFDQLFSVLDSASRVDRGQSSYPPYNIEATGEDKYRLTMALAGFSEQDLSIQLEQNTLTISGKQENISESKNYLHRGIATRNFERQFQLADHVKVADASLENGLLHVELVREIPEAMKPRKIEIQKRTTKYLEAEKAA